MKQASLKHLANLSQQLSMKRESKHYIQDALNEVKKILNFDFCVLYQVQNVVEDEIILEVIQIAGEQSIRPELTIGKKLGLKLKEPDERFANEVHCYLNLQTSNIPVPGQGCDIAGFFPTPADWGNGFIMSCDYICDDPQISEEAGYTFEIVCNMLMGAMMKNFYAHMATQDGLTGCYNKKTISNQLQTALYKNIRASDNWLSLAIIDIDHFKQINDNHGHLQGDNVLEEFAQLLRKSIRCRTDNLGRYGGEEFMLILENTSPQYAHYVLERIRKKVSQHKFQRVSSEGNELEDTLSITASVGIMSVHSKKSEIDTDLLIEKADKALYESKANGRNQVTMANDWEI